MTAAMWPLATIIAATCDISHVRRGTSSACVDIGSAAPSRCVMLRLHAPSSSSGCGRCGDLINSGGDGGDDDATPSGDATQPCSFSVRLSGAPTSGLDD